MEGQMLWCCGSWCVPAAHHGVHGEVVVLRLELHSVLVVHAHLCVVLQEHLLVVADPVKHLESITQ